MIKDFDKDAFKREIEKCTKEDYEVGLCKDANLVQRECKVLDVILGNCGCKEVGKKAYCCDVQGNCNYGVIKDTVEVPGKTKTFCVDTETQNVREEKDIREAKVKTKEETDKSSYSWTYVMSLAKMLDRTISNEYDFEEYYEYSLENYKKYIDKKENYSNMTVEQYRASELENAKADTIVTEDIDYRDEKTKIDDKNGSWNKGNLISSWSEVPKNSTIVSGTVTKKTVKVEENVLKQGKEYIDTYVWSNTLKFKNSNSGIYNIESVKEISGDDFRSSDVKYYGLLYDDKEINLIDIMNSDNTIFEQYTESENVSNNVGIDKNKLEISYNVLKKDLKNIAEEYPLSGLMYGNSLNIREGMNLSNIVAAEGTNGTLLALALSYKGNSLADMMTIDDCNIFWKADWCAMFVSYCMRKLEKNTGITIPIPNYFSCTSQCWANYHDKIGFFDVQEWVDANPTAQYVNSNPANIAPLSAIQPGDIVLFSWKGDKDPGNRDHTAIVQSVEKDESGKVTSITTVDGNWGSDGRGFNYSKVSIVEHVGFNTGYYDLGSIASFISISTVKSAFEKGNTW